jgi:predicted thioesterase
MIALMEQAALESVQPFLDEGQGTVGTRIEVSHLAATPVGMTVRAETELAEIDRKRLVFTVRAFAGEELIGEGRHERFIVDNGRFMQKALAKLN